jgi:hypothetical protein
MTSEKKEIEPHPYPRAPSIQTGTISPTKPPFSDEFEVFKSDTDGVQFRLVGWIKASVIFLKRISTYPRIPRLNSLR